MAAASLLSSCGTLIYPDRVNQKQRGKIDPTIVILDGIGLFLFLVPGLVAFAVDFATGAIYFPAGQGHGDEERTIFDDLSVIHSEESLKQHDIERIVSTHAGTYIDLNRDDVQVVELNQLNQFATACSRLAGKSNALG